MEAMADETESAQSSVESQPAPPPPPPPVDDGEKQRLAAELAQTKQALGEVAEMVKSGKLKLADENPPPEKEEDDTALVDRKELKRFAEDIKKTVAGAIVETTSQSARLTLANTKDLLRPKLKNFDKYESEMDTLLAKMDPRVAASPDTITQAYKVVRANHLDEEIEAEVAARASNREDDEDDAENQSPEESAPVGRIPGSMPSGQRGGVAPAGNAALSRTNMLNRPVIKPLSRDEKVAAGLWEMNAEEFRRYGDTTWRPDLLGAKGRRKF